MGSLLAIPNKLPLKKANDANNICHEVIMTGFILSKVENYGLTKYWFEDTDS